MNRLFTFLAAALICCAGIQTNVKAETMDKEIKLVQDWDKTFPKSEKVNHEKVTFKTQYGLTLAADLYIPKNAEGKLPAIAVSGPFGAVSMHRPWQSVDSSPSLSTLRLQANLRASLAVRLLPTSIQKTFWLL